MPKIKHICIENYYGIYDNNEKQLFKGFGEQPRLTKSKKSSETFLKQMLVSGANVKVVKVEVSYNID